MIKIRIKNADHEIDVRFPISENELYAKLAEIHAIEEKDAPQSAFVTEVYWPEEFSMLKDRFANLDELNYLAKRMESFDYHEYDQFLIGITKLQNPTEKDLINLTFNLDHFTLCKDVSSYGKIGREYVMNTQGAVPANDEDDPKYAAIGKELIDKGLAQITGKGLLIYLKADVKAIVNGIVSDLAADERIASLYDLWYEQREEVIRTYTEELPERIPLVDNSEFKSIKNVVIQEALNISADRLIADEQDEQAEVKAETSEPEADEVEEQEYAPAPRSVQRSRMWQLYRNAKELLDRESDAYDPNTAVNLLIEAAGLGCGVAKYRLGKMFLRGEDVPKSIDYALRWLEESVSEGNQYAEYLLGKTLLRGEDVEQDLPRAESLLRRSSDQGNRYASYTLGKTLLDGEILLQDVPEAIRLLADSAEKGFAAGQYQMGKLLYRGEVVPQDIVRAIDYLERAAAQKNPYAAYLAGKIRLTDAEVQDILRAIRDFEIAAENGNDYAEYQLGKIYLYGKEVERDYEKAIAYLSSAAEHGNQYAEQLLHSIQSNRNWSAALGVVRLLHHLSRMIQNQLDDEKKGKTGAIDRKLKRKIDEKKQAHGLKQG